ncbi:MAG: hypothetical protein PHO70_02530 [Candidatus Omnitrophica bacterium]|nr:hypothetical protein [Candidatus Omnitrophota bacterium]
MEKQISIENSLLAVIGNSGGKDLIKEASEIAIDHFLQEGILKDIPVVGTVANLFSIGIKTQGYIFTKKLQRFLFALSDISFQERQAFTARLDSDLKFRVRVGENLILLINKLDDMDKSELLARAFSGFVNNRYDYLIFHRLAVAIDRCIIQDLHKLERGNKRLHLEPHEAQILSSAGLVELEVIPQVRGEGVRNIYQITELGDLFCKFILE